MPITVIVSAELAATHCWPNAPADVAFLRHPHRHLFKVRVGVSEVHDFVEDGRETEFILFKARLVACLGTIGNAGTAGVRDIGTMSCENLAMELLSKLGDNVSFVEVLEDGENGIRLDV